MEFLWRNVCGYEDYIHKLLLRVVAIMYLSHNLLLASPNLGDEIPFKGGSL